MASTSLGRLTAGRRAQRALEAEDGLRRDGPRDRRLGRVRGGVRDEADVGAGVDAEAGVGGVQVADADPLVDRARLELLDEGLEVLVLAGPEVPVVVVGQLRGRAGGPGRRLRVDRGDAVVVAEAGEAAGLEGGDQERAVGGVRLQPARAGEPGDDLVGVGRAGRAQAEQELLEVARRLVALGDAHVGEGPALGRATAARRRSGPSPTAAACRGRCAGRARTRPAPRCPAPRGRRAPARARASRRSAWPACSARGSPRRRTRRRPGSWARRW